MSLLEKVTQMGKDIGLTDEKLVLCAEKNSSIVADSEEKNRIRKERRLEREAEIESERN